MSSEFLIGVVVGVMLPPAILCLAFAVFAIKTGWSNSLEKRRDK